MALNTSTDICNLALARLGSRFTIASLAEDSAEARVANLIYDQSLNVTLRRHPWNFATARAALALSGTAPQDWSYSYALPADCLHARYLTDTAPGLSLDPQPFEISGRLLFCNIEDAVLCYTKRATDVTQWDPSFIDCFILKLCADMAIPINGRAEVQREFDATWRAFMPEAAAIDSNEAKGLRQREAAWIEARGGY